MLMALRWAGKDKHEKQDAFWYVPREQSNQTGISHVITIYMKISR